jgi:hypothetical protein
MKMKNIFVSLLFFNLSIFAIAQNTGEDYYSPAAKAGLLSKDRVSVSMMAGTSLSFSNNRNNYISTYIAPKINYQLTEKLRLNLGMIHLTSYPVVFQAGNIEKDNVSAKKNNSNNLLFVGGEYQLNKKILVSGAVMTNPTSIDNKQNNYKAAAVGIDYKVSKHSTIGIRASISQGNENNFFDFNRGSINRSSSNFNPAGNTLNGMDLWENDTWNTSIR